MSTDLDIEKFTRMINPEVADATIALEFLLTVKSGVRNGAIALTEMATPEARTIVRNQLAEALDMHKKLSDLMISKGWLHPYEVNEQFKLDLQSADTTVTIAGLQLFPDNTSRLGMYDQKKETKEELRIT